MSDSAGAPAGSPARGDERTAAGSGAGAGGAGAGAGASAGEVTPLWGAPAATGLVYDGTMMLHMDPTGPHPEQPARIQRIYQRLQDLGLAERCVRIKSREVTDEELTKAHTSRYVEKVKRWRDADQERLFSRAAIYNSIYLNPHSALCASLAAGSVVEACQAVARGDLANALAVVRPPGHHAESPNAMGFCIYNNVAVAAHAALAMDGIDRVLIVDWDVHHGNGTQHMFEDDPRVMYFSTHRYDFGAFYPCSGDAAPQAVGKGAGKGKTVNVAFNSGPKGDGDYISAWQHVLLPLATEFDPDLVIVSAGFDAALGDPLGGYKITPPGYAHMTHLLKTLAGGRIVVALEGGYNLSAISESMAFVAGSLLGETPPRLPGPSFPSMQGQKAVASTLACHAEHWHCLAKPKPELEPDSTSTDGEGGEESEVSDGDDAAPAATADGDSYDLSAEMAAGFSVNPLSYCEHVKDNVMAAPSELDASAKCSECDNVKENWICLGCGKVCCGRFANGHMVEHYKTGGHCVAASYADLSFWCYEDDAYLNNYKIPALGPWYSAMHIAKFGEAPPSRATTLTLAFDGSSASAAPAPAAAAAPGGVSDAAAPAATPAVPMPPPAAPAGPAPDLSTIAPHVPGAGPSE